MDKSKIMTVLQGIFADVFIDEDIRLTDETNANDIEGWDSLTHITILEAVQDTYHIVFELDEIIEMKSVGDIVNAIMAKGD